MTAVPQSRPANFPDAGAWVTLLLFLRTPQIMKGTLHAS